MFFHGRRYAQGLSTVVRHTLDNGAAVIDAHIDLHILSKHQPHWVHGLVRVCDNLL